MTSFNWPHMFSSMNSRLLHDKDAVRSNFMLLLNSEKLSLFGDPYFGTVLKSVIFQPNNNILADLIIDELYQCIKQYIPQLYLTRNDIIISSDHINLYADINVIYKFDNSSDLYTIQLTNNEGET